MQMVKNNFLKVIPYLQFDLWDTKRYTSISLTSNYDIVRMDFCIKEENKKYKIYNEKEKEFGILGVNNKTGIYDAYVEKGMNINQAYKKMEVGWIAYNPYRINVGSIGIRLENHKNEYISPAYVVFSCKNNILPEYLFFLFKSNRFNQIIKESTTGSVRQNLTIDILKKLKIPLPSISQQKTIIKNYYSKIQEAEALEKQANDLNEDIEKYLFNSLGIIIQDNFQKCKFLQFINFESTSRWDSLFLLGKVATLQSKYQLIIFSDVIKNFNKDTKNNSIRFESNKFPDNNYRYIGMEHIEKGTGVLIDMPIVKGNEIKSQTLKVPKDFFIYGKLRPYLNKFWINRTVFENIICSSEFFVFDIEETINKEFFKYVLSSKIIQDQISDKTSGARMPRINEEIFFNLKFPLPPKHIQDNIAQKISDLKSKIEQSKEKAFNLTRNAQQEFENEIFN